jgi:DNA polymerase-3 subunit delta'
MLFDEIIEQERAKEILSRVLGSGRVPHAFLFAGPWGVGKTTTALAAARALVCERGPLQACDACASCGKARRFVHPDVHFYFPMPSFRSGDAAAKARREILEEMAADPLYVVQFEKAHSIKIDEIREIKSRASLRPVEASCRVVILSGAEKMTEEASNSLLKVLEEPPDDMIFFLTASKPERLLPTIVSRCREVSFSPLSQEAIARVLTERRGVSPERASLAAALSRGSLAAAVTHGEEDLASWRDRALAVFDTGRPGHDAELHAGVQGLLSEGGRTSILRAVEIMRVWCRDLLLARCEAPEDLIANRDRRDRLAAEAKGVSIDEIRRRAAVLEDMSELVEGNVNPSLVLYGGVLRYSDPSLGPASIAASFPHALFRG